MTGYLDRLVRRARGEPTGLRPRQPAAFEPAPLLPETETFEVEIQDRVVGPPPVASPTGAPRADSPRTTNGGLRRSDAAPARGPAPLPAPAARLSHAPSPQRADDTAPRSGPTPQHPVTRGADAVPSSRQPSRSPAKEHETAYESVAATSTTRPPDAIPTPPPAWSAAPALPQVAPTRALRDLPPRAAAPSPEPDTVIEVRIGRVEVAPAPAAPPKPAHRDKVARPPVELSDYLKARRSSR